MQTLRHHIPQRNGKMFVADGGIEAHMIFNLGQDVSDMSVDLLNMSEAGREAMRDYYRAYIPICQKAGQAFPVRVIGAAAAPATAISGRSAAPACRAATTITE